MERAQMVSQAVMMATPIMAMGVAQHVQSKLTRQTTNISVVRVHPIHLTNALTVETTKGAVLKNVMMEIKMTMTAAPVLAP